MRDPATASILVKIKEVSSRRTKEAWWTLHDLKQFPRERERERRRSKCMPSVEKKRSASSLFSVVFCRLLINY